MNITVVWWYEPIFIYQLKRGVKLRKSLKCTFLICLSEHESFSPVGRVAVRSITEESVNI